MSADADTTTVYHLCVAYSKEKLEAEVTQLLHDGWLLLGSTQLTAVNDDIAFAKVARASGRVRQSLADDLERQADALRERGTGRKITDALARAELAKKLADASDRVFQWSQQSATQLVQVETMLDLEHKPSVTVLPGSNDTQAASIAPTQDVQDIDPAI